MMIFERISLPSPCLSLPCNTIFVIGLETNTDKGGMCMIDKAKATLILAPFETLIVLPLLSSKRYAFYSSLLKPKTPRSTFGVQEGVDIGKT